MTFRGHLLNTLGLIAMLSLGCDKPAESTPAAKPAAQAAPSATSAKPADTKGQSDMAALKSFVESERGVAPSQTKQQSQQPELPAGHPPINQPAAATPPPAQSGSLPSGHPPISGGGSANPAAPSPTDLKYESPADWKPQPPASSMRKAQFILPRADGDAEDAELIVFYFGKGEGGSVAENLARWRGMLTKPDGSPIADSDAGHETFEANGMKVTLLDVRGRYAPSAMPGMAKVAPREDYRMLAAVVETPNGPWFFKAVGPAGTIVKHREAMITMLKSARN